MDADVTNPSDKAERLHNLITKMQQGLTDISIPGIGAGRDVELWRSFELIAQKLGFEDYGQFRDQYLALSSSLKVEVQTISLRKESVRVAWIDCISMMQKVFDASNFAIPTYQVFGNHFSSTSMATLETISERLQTLGMHESAKGELENALDAVRDAIDEFGKTNGIDERILRILRHHLHQMEQIYSRYDDFGDDVFWSVYKETFGTFVQIHQVIVGKSNETELKNKLTAVASYLSAKSIAGISLAANVATIAALILAK